MRQLASYHMNYHLILALRMIIKAYNFGNFFLAMCNALNPDRGFKVRKMYYLKSSGDFGKCENIKSSRISCCSFGPGFLLAEHFLSSSILERLELEFEVQFSEFKVLVLKSLKNKTVKLFKSNIVQEQHISNKGHIITLAAYDVFHNIFLKAKYLAPQKNPGGRKDIARPCRKYVQ